MFTGVHKCLSVCLPVCLTGKSRYYRPTPFAGTFSVQTLILQVRTLRLCDGRQNAHSHWASWVPDPWSLDKESRAEGQDEGGQGDTSERRTLGVSPTSCSSSQSPLHPQLFLQAGGGGGAGEEERVAGSFIGHRGPAVRGWAPNLPLPCRRGLPTQAGTCHPWSPWQ